MPELLHLSPLPTFLLTLMGAVVVMAWRFKETQTPVTIKKIVIPPLGMSTGLMMFVVPETRVPWWWAAIAIVSGALLFAYPLMRSSKLTKVGEQVLMQRSRAFLWILLGLLAVRFALRAYIEQTISTPQTGALFFLLALAAIVRWRVAMLREFLALTRAST